MTSPKSKRAAHSSAADTTEAVNAFMAGLDHPFNELVQSIRASIMAVDPGIAEGIKWNSPSYRTNEYFATTNLREKQGVGVILHLGAKVRVIGPDGLSIADPEGLLKWLAKDRAQLVFASVEDFSTKRAAFETLVRSWIEHV